MKNLLTDILIAFQVTVIFAAAAFLVFVGVMLFSITQVLSGFTEAVLKTMA